MNNVDKILESFDEQLADSTIAMSAYNLIVKFGRCTMAELHRSLSALAHPELNLDKTMLALAALKERGLVREFLVNGSGECCYVAANPHLGVVVMRDRSDMRIDSAQHKAIGGWCSWTASDERGKLTTITNANEDRSKR
jgi:hypothetical protein